MKRFRFLVQALAGLLAGAGAALSIPSALASNCVTLSVSLSKSGSKQVCDTGNGGVIVAYLILIIQFVSALVGAVIVLMLIIAGIQYLTSAGDPGAVKAAKSRIVNAITALVLFIFMYAILNLILPSGVLK